MAICCLLCHLLPGHQGELQLSGVFFPFFLLFFLLIFPLSTLQRSKRHHHDAR